VLSTESIFGLVLILICVVAMIVFSMPLRNRPAVILRQIAAFQHLRRAIGLAIEDGKRLHVSLGNGTILGPNNASALVGLNALEKAAQISIISDRPVVATSGDGSLSILSQDTLRAAYRTNNVLEQYNPDRARLAGVTPFSYIAGSIPVAKIEQVSANILVGHFGPEVALLCEYSDQKGIFTLAASDSLPAQAAMFATAHEPLIGEELFALPAYLQAAPIHQASLRAQDILRWILIAVLIGGALLKLVGAVTGAPLI
jgi:hypothetical protein